MSEDGGLPSAAMRTVILVCASLHVLLASGEAFGWTALRPVLYNTGFFDDYSDLERARLLNNVSTLGIAANALCKLPLGVFLDSCGPRLTSIVGSIMLIAGAVIMGWCDEQSLAFQGSAYFLLGASGPFIQMSCFQFANLFPSLKTSIISFMITLFELSTGVFYIFNVTNRDLGLGRSELFSAYAVCGVFTLATAVILWPDRPYGLPAAPSTEEDAEGSEEGADDKADGEEHSEVQPAGSKTPLWERSFIQQLATWEFTYLLIFFTIHNFTQGLVMTTMGPQVAYFFPDKETSEMLAEVFSIVLPLGFLPVLLCTFAGISGFILSRFNLSFVVTTVLSCMYGALFLWPSIPAYITLFVLFPVARQFCFSTFISYSAETFGFRTFGSINGLASTIAGVVQLGQTWVVEEAANPEGLFGWEGLDLAMAVVPMALVIPPIISWCCGCRASAAPSSFDPITEPLLTNGSSTTAPDLPVMSCEAHSQWGIEPRDDHLSPVDIPRLGSLTMSGPIALSLGSQSALHA